MATEWKVSAYDGQELAVGVKMHFSMVAQLAGDSFPIRPDDWITVTFKNNTQISLRVTVAPDDLRLLRVMDDEEPSSWHLTLATAVDGADYVTQEADRSSWQWWVIREQLPMP